LALLKSLLSNTSTCLNSGRVPFAIKHFGNLKNAKYSQMDWQMAFSISYVIESVRRKFRTENSKLPYLIGSRSFIKHPFVHKCTAVEFLTANTFSIAFAPILFYLGWKVELIL